MSSIKGIGVKGCRSVFSDTYYKFQLSRNSGTLNYFLSNVCCCNKGFRCRSFNINEKQEAQEGLYRSTGLYSFMAANTELSTLTV